MIRTPNPLLRRQPQFFFPLHAFSFFSCPYTNSGFLLSLKARTHFLAVTYLRGEFCYGFLTLRTNAPHDGPLRQPLRSPHLSARFSPCFHPSVSRSARSKNSIPSALCARSAETANRKSPTTPAPSSLHLSNWTKPLRGSRSRDFDQNPPERIFATPPHVTSHVTAFAKRWKGCLQHIHFAKELSMTPVHRQNAIVIHLARKPPPKDRSLGPSICASVPTP